MPKLTDKLFKANRINTYSVRESVMDERKHLPNNFRENVLLNALSSHITRNNQMYDFIQFVQLIVSNWIDAVTTLKVFKSYTVKNDYKKVS